jgi:hypothetical protein
VWTQRSLISQPEISIDGFKGRRVCRFTVNGTISKDWGSKQGMGTITIIGRQKIVRSRFDVGRLWSPAPGFSRNSQRPKPDGVLIKDAPGYHRAEPK